MDISDKIKLIKTIAGEIVTEEELWDLLKTKEHPVAYDGFEPSGLAPIHFGLLRAINAKKLIEAGIRMKLYLADYFAFINNKMEGDLAKIRLTGEYFTEVWRAAGVDLSKVEIVWASDLMKGLKYWDRVLTVAREITLSKTIKSLTIAGRNEKDILSTAQLFYPSMQVADIFELGVDICQLGMDQRRANMLARDVADKLNWKKPVAVHHHMLLGLKGLIGEGSKEETIIASKMSKSDPESCIYVHDTPDQIKEKIRGAFCPPSEVEGNPILEYFKYIIFPSIQRILIKRLNNHGGNILYENYHDLEKDYKEGKLHPLDLKNSSTEELDKLIKPIREHFLQNKRAKKLYQKVMNFRITR